MSEIDDLKAEIKKLSAKAMQAKMDLHDLSEELHQLELHPGRGAKSARRLRRARGQAREAEAIGERVMSEFKTRDGREYVPQYLTDINASTCIGCGRCFKVCPQGVMGLYGVNDEGEILGAVTDDEDDDNDFDGELNRKIMKVEEPGAASAATPARESARRTVRRTSPPTRSQLNSMGAAAASLR